MEHAKDADTVVNFPQFYEATNVLTRTLPNWLPRNSLIVKKTVCHLHVIKRLETLGEMYGIHMHTLLTIVFVDRC